MIRHSCDLCVCWTFTDDKQNRVVVFASTVPLRVPLFSALAPVMRSPGF
jgi:hypothetical protein